MSKNHFTLSFSLKSPADAKVLGDQLPRLMPALFQAADTIGTIHYSRFTVLSEKTLLFLGDFDGEFGELMSNLALHAGTVFDAIFEHVDHPPTTSVADQAEVFVEWTAAHLVHPLNIYTAYPGVTAKEIKALASAADVSGASEQRPFLVILPIKSPIAFVEVELLLRARGRGTTKDLDTVGTPHLKRKHLSTRSHGSPFYRSRSCHRMPVKRHISMLQDTQLLTADRSGALIAPAVLRRLPAERHGIRAGSRCEP